MVFIIWWPNTATTSGRRSLLGFYSRLALVSAFWKFFSHLPSHWCTKELFSLNNTLVVTPFLLNQSHNTYFKIYFLLCFNHKNANCSNKIQWFETAQILHLDLKPLPSLSSYKSNNSCISPCQSAEFIISDNVMNTMVHYTFQHQISSRTEAAH